MARQVKPLEFNTVVGGLVTDAGPLTFPANGSLAEENMVLDPSGLRRRRLGMDFEDSYSEITTNITFDSTATYGHSVFKWDNAGYDPSISLLVIQFGNEIKFFNLANTQISSEVIDTYTFSSSTVSNNYSYAVVDGLLVVVTGEKTITVFEYDADANTISTSTDYLTVRDLWGIDVEINSEKLREGQNVTIRPSTINDSHKYNLRNQSWATPRRDGNNETDIDPITAFYNEASKYPSNSDAVTKALYPDANDSDNRTIDRFFASDLVTNQYGSSHAALGHYIIDAMDRGSSRKTVYDKTISENSSVTMLTISSLPTDKTEGGPSVIEQFAGRAFFAGFNGELTGGDNRSPRMASYVLFSKQVDSIADITRCYQEGDPTSIEEPELLDTDGGFIRIDEAYGIKSLKNLGDALFVFAQNGVWYIQGTDSGGNFTATGYRVVKVSDRGSVGSNSVVEMDDAVIYWGEDGIYTVGKNQLGDWQITSLSNNRIDDFYRSIDSIAKINAVGQYDGYSKNVHFVYSNTLGTTDYTQELVFDRNLGAFYTNKIYHPEDTQVPKVISVFKANPFRVSTVQQQVQVGAGNDVQVSGESVTVSVQGLDSLFRELHYVIATRTTNGSTIKYTMGYYKDENFLDFFSYNDTGIDAAGYMITGYISGGNFLNSKQALFMQVYMGKTETGYETDVNGDLSPLNTSSVKIQTQWDWTNSVNSNRWSSTWEGYRHRRAYLPTGLSDTFDDGHSVVMSKNKVRGKGQVLSIKFSTSPGKDFKLYGWSMLAAINERE